MKQFLFYGLFLFVAVTAQAQHSYKDSLDLFLENYVKDHQVVTGADKQYFRFFPVDETYRVTARFRKEENSPWTAFPTSSGKTKQYRIYGWLEFKLHGSDQKLAVYQSQFLLQQKEYSDYLFLPFKDATNGKDSYQTGRYLDLKTSDIKEGTVVLDFNKAYNPYCAYVSTGYSCPVPPKENHLKIAVNAGEKQFAREH
ncbi:DUF1684 domain-containing protein [Niabella beijingensis]|uniref:DUF1684 domain-containing protein n=1 Tax=Niabella beijingensis TaxID=2872700 RepID=UPI001CBB2031|nr:DUF1684 domain-containing protein [Niabella beijingensis]MBZ4187832.1 DUF1684 domain-containing protein [Niabella beijingensis]